MVVVWLVCVVVFFFFVICFSVTVSQSSKFSKDSDFFLKKLFKTFQKLLNVDVPRNPYNYNF